MEEIQPQDARDPEREQKNPPVPVNPPRFLMRHSLQTPFPSILPDPTRVLNNLSLSNT
jgi:hypothetical protein